MKKLLSIILLGCITLVVGCEKNNEIPQKNLSDKASESKIQVVNGMLSFDSFEEYEATINALATECENYSREYYENVAAQLGTDDDNLINDQMQQEKFSQFEPIHQFEKKYGITSYHSVLEELERQWMESPTATAENHPFANSYLARYQSALHNTDGNVLIAGEIFNPEADVRENRDDCEQSAVRRYETTFTYNGQQRKLVGILRIVTTSVSAESYLYTIKNGKATAWSNNIYVGDSGYKRMQDCYDGAELPINAKHSSIWGCAASVVSMTNNHPNYISKNPVNALQSTHKAINAGVIFNISY